MKQQAEIYANAIAFDDAELLITSLPEGVDLDHLADAFVTFIEDMAEMRGPDILAVADGFSWTETTPNAFHAECARRKTRGGTAPFLQAVWTPGRLAIIARAQALTGADWSHLRERLAASQEGLARPNTPWKILHAPLAPLPVVTPLPAPLVGRTLRRVDRRQPIAASPEQIARMKVFSRQEDGRHRMVTMEPILLQSPDLGAVEATFEVLQERYEILHSLFLRADGVEYVRLTDALEVPFEPVSIIRPFVGIERIAADQTRALAEAPLPDGPLWRAALVTRGKDAAILCVLSEAIADPRTAALLRADILRCYEAFSQGQDPERDWPMPQLQYIDYAANAQSPATARDWWDAALPVQPVAEESRAAPPIAPVEAVDQTLSPDVTRRVKRAAETSGLPLRAIVFRAFVQTLRHIEPERPDWLLVSLQDRRPPELSEMLGPFSIDCPVWLGDLGGSAGPATLHRRVSEIEAGAALTEPALRAALEGRVPRRIPYLFDWCDDATTAPEIASAQDIVLRAAPCGDGIALRWAVRLDHPFSRHPRQVGAIFSDILGRHLDA